MECVRLFGSIIIKTLYHQSAIVTSHTGSASLIYSSLTGRHQAPVTTTYSPRQVPVGENRLTTRVKSPMGLSKKVFKHPTVIFLFCTSDGTSQGLISTSITLKNTSFAFPENRT